MIPYGGKDAAAQRSTWTGRSYDLGKMSFRDLALAYLTYYAIDAYLRVPAITALVAVGVGAGWVPLALAILAAIVVYPFAWSLIPRFILHSRSLYKSRWTAA